MPHDGTSDSALDPKDARRMVVGGGSRYVLFREYVYGLESIDEHVLEVDPVNHVETYILQDVSGNVVGAVDPNDEYHVEQFFDPYGLWERATSIWTTINGTSYVTLDPDDGVDDTTEYMWTTTGLHGHFYDRESGLYWMRGRYYPPRWQRFLSNDPIGTGLLPVTSLSYGGMPFAIDVAVNAGTQFTDGPNPYEFVRSNPITGRDPSGLFFTYADLGVSSAIQSNLAGQYLDVGASTVDAMKGVILWGNDRNATIDNLLGVSSNPFDTSGIDSALSIYNSYQSMQTALLGAAAVTKVVGLGKKLWARYVSRAGSRQDLIETLERGTTARRQLFRFAEHGPGSWVKVNEGMSTRAAAYQRQITGRAGEAYVVNGVKFDGFVDGALVDAKGPGYVNFIKGGEFRGWYRGGGRIFEQAKRQVKNSGGFPVHWHVADREFADVLRAKFQKDGIGISVIHTPAQ